MFIVHHIVTRSSIDLAEVYNFFIWYVHGDVLEDHLCGADGQLGDDDHVALKLYGGFRNGVNWSTSGFKLITLVSYLDVVRASPAQFFISSFITSKINSLMSSILRLEL